MRTHTPRVRCVYCHREFYAARVDTLYCSQKCRSRQRVEDGKFRHGNRDRPRSGVPGITFRVDNGHWEIKIKVEGKWKYVGLRKDLREAVEYQKYLSPRLDK